MFDFLKFSCSLRLAPRESKKPPPPLHIRETIFGDMEDWAPKAAAGAGAPPWSLFLEARRLIELREPAQAKLKLQELLALPDLESRHYLQAWHALRKLGVTPPPAEAKSLLGVVVEVAMPQGFDSFAVYADRSARYWNFSGKYLVWQHEDTSLDALIDAVLVAGRELAQRIGPWDGPRPPAPTGNLVRICLLTPSGLHFGQGDQRSLARDPIGGPVLQAAAKLMSAMVARLGTAGSTVARRKPTRPDGSG